MAHIYVGLRNPAATGSQRESVVNKLIRRPSVDLLLLPGASKCHVLSADRGAAEVSWTANSFSYIPDTGDPLAIGAQVNLSADAAYSITRDSLYPDALVQIAFLAQSPRSGDVIASAAPGWDFRARYEPIPHVSTHGSLRREHMLVPLLTNRPPKISPRRTTDIMPSALTALGIPVPANLDGVSFL
jgi:hypothetical protein